MHEIDFFRMLDLNVNAASGMSVEAIRKAVRAKKKMWTMQCSNPLFQQESRSNLDQIRAFDSLLDDPKAFAQYAMRMKDQRQQMQRMHQQRIGKLIHVAMGNRKSITSPQLMLLKKFATDHEIPQDIVDTTLKRLKIGVGEQLPAVRDTRPVPYHDPALDRTTLAQIDGWLAILDKSSFYELLDLSSNIPVQTIRREAKFLFEKWSKVLPKSSQVVAWEKSLQACLTYVKDQSTKQRYDAALFNRRIDQFLLRVDIVLASGVLDKEMQMELARMGMREWGLSTGIIEQCIRHRASKLGLDNNRVVSVSMQMHGQSQCMRCFAWSPVSNSTCWHCGCSLIERCKNPDCRHTLARTSKRCDQCSLPISQGRRFAEFLKSADKDLSNGNVVSALDACRRARRILPSLGVTQRIDRAGKILATISVAKHRFAIRELSATHDALAELKKLAPEFRLAGVPTLNRLTAEMLSLQQKLQAVLVDSSVADVAKTCSQILTCWTDGKSAFQQLWTCCESLIAGGNSAEAARYAKQLRSIRPDDKYVSAWANQIEQRLRELHNLKTQHEEIHQSLCDALSENRLYAARECFSRLAKIGKQAPDQMIEFKKKAADLNQALREAKTRAESATTQDDAIGFYRVLLQRYPDCRDALAIVQRAKPSTPETLKCLETIGT